MKDNMDDLTMRDYVALKVLPTILQGMINGSLEPMEGYENEGFRASCKAAYEVADKFLAARGE